MGLILVGLTARSHVGGGINALMPAILALSLLTGLAMTGAERRSPQFRHVAPFLILLQFLAMAIDWGALHEEHPPRLQDPTR